jgi:hypothetical protein
VGAASAGIGIPDDGGIGAGGGTGGMLAGGGGGGAGGVGGFCASSEPVSSNDPTAMKGSNGLRGFMIDTPCQNEGSNDMDRCHPTAACAPGFMATLSGRMLPEVPYMPVPYADQAVVKLPCRRIRQAAC